MRPLVRVILHHSASPRSTTTANQITEWHKAKGWNTIGYHWVVEDGGVVVAGRPLDMRGAHCPQDNANYDSIGICITGDNTVEGEGWSEEQINAAVRLTNSLCFIFGISLVYGHRDVPGTATLCPGLDVRALLGRTR